MQYRTFGRTGWQVSEIGFGAWQIGGQWGAVDDDEMMLRQTANRIVNHRLAAEEDGPLGGLEGAEPWVGLGREVGCNLRT